MSLEATLWAMCLAPVPEDVVVRRPNQRKPEGPGNMPQEHRVVNSACGLVLLGLANSTGNPDGKYAYPAVELLTLYSRLSERAVRNALDRLESDGLIARSAAGGPADSIRADRRPVSYDLNLRLMRRDDLTEDQLQRIARANPFIEPHIERMLADRRGAAGVPTGCSDNTDGVQGQSPRGAEAAPEPLMNLTTNRKDEPQKNPASRRKPKTRMPEGWKPKNELAALAQEHGLNPGREFESFKAWTSAGDYQYAEWDSAFRQHLLKSIERAEQLAKRPSGGYGQKPSIREQAEQMAAAAASLQARFDAANGPQQLEIGN